MPVFDSDAPGGDFEEVRFVQDAPSGLRAVVAVHSTQRGPAFGGIRRRAYPDEAAALDDVRRLAEGMTLKLALAGLPAGGAKTVILDAPGDPLPRYAALGRVVDGMGGRYVCGPDVGTGVTDLDAVRAATRWVNPRGNDANAATAAGVLAGIRGTLAALGLNVDAARFVVQGLGGVGGTVAAMLHAGGGHVTATDIDPAAVGRARAAGMETVLPEDALRTPCDVFVPCALGGILTPATAEALPARAVCGSANNQLADASAGRVLHDRGILYAPDFAVNIGAVAEGVLTTLHGATDQVRRDARRHIDGVEDTVRRILEASQVEGRPPEDVALGMARAALG